MKELAEKVKNRLDVADIAGALELVDGVQSVDLAEILEHIDPVLGWQLLEKLEPRAEVFGYLDPHAQLLMAEKLPRKALAGLISEMRSDERADLWNSFDEAQRDLLLPGIEKAKREDMRRLASYKEGCAGALMSSDYAVLSATMSTREAIEALRHAAVNAETIYWAYVVDKDQKLQGVISLRKLLLARDTEQVSELMNSHFISARDTEDQEEVARLIERYDLIALPVVNADNQLVGIVTHDDALDVLVDEATDDIYKGGGLTSEAGLAPDAKISVHYRSRIFWLAILVFGNLFSGAAIGAFEEIIEANIVLVFFLPLLIDSGGNAGSQSSTMMVRALATGDVQLRDWFHLLGREAIVAVLLGVTLAFLVSILGLFRGDMDVAIVLAITMICIVLIGCLIGMSLPFVLSRFNLDPASASAPLVTSICDATGVTIYLFVASQILPTI